MSEPRYRLAPPNNAPVYCKQCGALVIDTVAHTQWHSVFDAATVQLGAIDLARDSLLRPEEET